MAERRLTTFRADAADLAAIDRLAAERGMSRTQYLTDAALGRLPEAVLSTEERFEAVEQRLDALERRAELGGFE